MSGGHWGSAAFLMRDNLENIYEDIITDFPKLAKILNSLGSILYDMIYELDYDVSGDSFILDKQKFQEEFIEKMRKILNEEENNIE